MVVHAVGPDFDWAEEPPNPKAQEFYDILKAANEPLWDGCDIFPYFCTYSRKGDGKNGLPFIYFPNITA